LLRDLKEESLHSPAQSAKLGRKRCEQTKCGSKKKNARPAKKPLERGPKNRSAKMQLLKPRQLPMPRQGRLRGMQTKPLERQLPWITKKVNESDKRISGALYLQI